MTTEHDFAGVVVNPNGSHWSAGDQVFGWIPVGRSSVHSCHRSKRAYGSITSGLNIKTKEGALSEYTVVPADHITTRPPNITPTQAAGIALAGITAYQALFRIAKLEAGQTLFINGGSTSVGAFATIFAKSRGIKVVASASGKNEAFVRRMGADEVGYSLDFYAICNAILTNWSCEIYSFV